MKTENTLSGIAVVIAGLTITDLISFAVAITVGVIAILVNLSKLKNNKIQKKILEEQLKQLSDEK